MGDEIPDVAKRDIRIRATLKIGDPCFKHLMDLDIIGRRAFGVTAMNLLALQLDTNEVSPATAVLRELLELEIASKSRRTRVTKEAAAPVKAREVKKPASTGRSSVNENSKVVVKRDPAFKGMLSFAEQGWDV